MCAKVPAIKLLYHVVSIVPGTPSCHNLWSSRNVKNQHISAAAIQQEEAGLRKHGLSKTRAAALHGFFFVLLAARRHHTHHLHIPELLQPFVPEQLEITLPQYKLVPNILAVFCLLVPNSKPKVLASSSKKPLRTWHHKTKLQPGCS